MSAPSPPARAPVYVLSPQVGGIGGAAVATMLLCESLVRRDYPVTLFVTSAPSSSVSERLQALGVRVVGPYISKGWNYGWPAMQTACRLKRFSGREIALGTIGMGLTLESRYALQLSVPNLHLWENTEALPGNKFVDARIRELLSRAAGLIAPSRTIEANVRSTYGWQGEVRRLPFWCERPAPPLPGAQRPVRNFLYVGRLDPDKGLLQLVDAFRRVEKTHPEARLTIAGGGSFPDLEMTLEAAPNISHRGYVCDSAYEELFASADVCVLPSLHEGYPLSLIESCARAKPVLATRVGSIPELFEGRRAALLVPPNDIAALTDGLTALLDEDLARYRARCTDARQLYEERADLDVIDRQVDALMRDIGQSGASHR